MKKMGRPWPEKMTADKVKSLRQKRSNGTKVVDLASEFNISKGTVTKICQRQLWPGVE